MKAVNAEAYEDLVSAPTCLSACAKHGHLVWAAKHVCCASAGQGVLDDICTMPPISLCLALFAPPPP